MDTKKSIKRRIVINMENNQDENKINFFRWFIAVVLIIILFVQLVAYKLSPSFIHILIVATLFCFGVADRFKFIKIPGIIELKDKTETIDKKLDTVVSNVQQIQNLGVNLYFNSQLKTDSIEYDGPEATRQVQYKTDNIK